LSINLLIIKLKSTFYSNKGKKMPGWTVPPPKTPTKSDEEFKREREAKVGELHSQGFLKSERLRKAMLKVPREAFIPSEYRDYAYHEVPLPLPGEKATISCPHSYPLFYEPLGLDKGHKFLEVGLGSGYGAAIAKEVVGSNGIVVSIDIDPVTFEFAKKNLENAGYDEIILVRSDGGLGYLELAPYDRICITAACPDIPPPLTDQLKAGGKLIAPVIREETQLLVLLEKTDGHLDRTVICEVLYVNLRGTFG
jgi:protein-L-isoaspartate(D-aspartate) O-methyltransferase